MNKHVADGAGQHAAAAAEKTCPAQHRCGDRRIFLIVTAEKRHRVVRAQPSREIASQAQNVQRGFRWLPGSRELIQDELTGLSPGAEVRWQMLTRATIELEGAAAVLRQDGKTMRIQLLTTGEGRDHFTAMPASAPDDGFNAPNPGVYVLRATQRVPREGSLRFAVVLGADEAMEIPAPLVPLETW